MLVFFFFEVSNWAGDLVWYGRTIPRRERGRPWRELWFVWAFINVL